MRFTEMKTLVAGTDNGLFDLGFMQLWENRDPKSKFSLNVISAKFHALTNAENDTPLFSSKTMKKLSLISAAMTLGQTLRCTG